jgi:hypothetical protein
VGFLIGQGFANNATLTIDNTTFQSDAIGNPCQGFGTNAGYGATDISFIAVACGMAL